jgi:hypothetical protein
LAVESVDMLSETPCWFAFLWTALNRTRICKGHNKWDIKYELDIQPLQAALSYGKELNAGLCVAKCKSDRWTDLHKIQLRHDTFFSCPSVIRAHLCDFFPQHFIHCNLNVLKDLLKGNTSHASEFSRKFRAV